MPALLGPLVGFCLGVAFAWITLKAGDHDRGALRYRGLLVVSGFSVLVYAPVTGYFLAFAEDWAVAYWFNAGELPVAVPLLWLTLDVCAPPLGFLLAMRPDQTRTRTFLTLGSGPAIAALVLFVVSAKRLRVFGTYRQFHEDFGVNQVWGTQLGYALAWMLTALLVGAAWTAHALTRLQPPQRAMPPRERRPRPSLG
ncbi:MAG: hypothetical protein KIT72_10160 [Polyangiaceae bacterium]|nr:hypothetical protein [Polyangiaceae bacterium]MCW5790774.1 hypothetical protein [Polyangiaceae bacterium]